MISTCQSPLRQPMVPNARPMSQIASAQPLSSRSVCSGRAEVVKSRSLCCGRASRRGPGRRPGASSWPAAAKRAPSSSMTGAIRSSSAATRALRLGHAERRGAASDTGGNSRARRRAPPRGAPGGTARQIESRAVLRRSSLLPALVAVAATALARWSLADARGAAPAPASAPRHRGDRAAGPTPTSRSRSRIDTLTPSDVPATGPDPGHAARSPTHRRDLDADQRLRVHRRRPPMTTPRELAEAADDRRRRRVGDRITDAGHLRRHRRARARARPRSFTVRLPRSAPRSPRAGRLLVRRARPRRRPPTARDDLADGRARTFLPLVPPASSRPDARRWCSRSAARIRHAADGSVDDLDALDADLCAGGRLRALVDFGAAAGDRRHLAGRPRAARRRPPARAATRHARWPDARRPRTRRRGAVAERRAERTPSPEAAERRRGARRGRSEPRPARPPTPRRAWLDRLERRARRPTRSWPCRTATSTSPPRPRTTRGSTTGAARRARHRAGAAGAADHARRSRRPSGYLDAARSPVVDRDATMLVTDRMFGADRAGRRRASTATGVLVTSSGAAARRARPGDPLSPLAVRQRILSEAAVRRCSTPRPAAGRGAARRLGPAPTTRRSSTGLDVAWLDLTVAEAAAARPTAVPADELATRASRSAASSTPPTSPRPTR